MGRRLRQTVTALATTALAAGAIVAVFYALPDGQATEAAADTTVTSGSVATPMTTAASTSTGAPAMVSVPALEAPATGTPTTETPGSTTAGDAGATSADAAQVSGESVTSSAGTTTETTPPAASPAPPAAPQAPAAPSAPQAPATPAVTTAPTSTAAPKTTAQAPVTKTAAPKTTAPKTTAPKTTAAPPAKAPSFGIPVTVGNAQQVITVTVASKSATSGTLRAWQQQADGSWRVVAGPVKAWLGRQGIGTPSESASRTPQGTYTLTEAFGRLADPGTALPYRVTGANDWWVSDTRAATYNTLQTCAPAACPFNTKVSERLQYIKPYYDYAVVMDVNRGPVVPGGGSAFFLHVSVGAPTEGCVAIDKATLVQILRWLDPAQHPRIAVGVG